MAELLTGIDLSTVLSDVKALLPVILPVSLGFIAFRKGLDFLFGSLKRA